MNSHSWKTNFERKKTILEKISTHFALCLVIPKEWMRITFGISKPYQTVRAGTMTSMDFFGNFEFRNVFDGQDFQEKWRKLFIHASFHKGLKASELFYNLKMMSALHQNQSHSIISCIKLRWILLRSIDLIARKLFVYHVNGINSLQAFLITIECEFE